jgi:signal transduction histidine kinase
MLALSFVPELVSGVPLLDYVWTFPALVLTPLSVGLAVKSGAMGKIDRLLNRSLVYALLVTLLLGLYVFFSTLDLFPSQTWSRPLLAGLLAVAAIILYNPLRLLLQRLVDRLFYGGWYSYHKVVREASTELSRALDLPELIQRLMSIVRTMRFEAATLLWPQDGYLSPAGSLGNAMTSLDGRSIPQGGVLVHHLTLRQHSYQQEHLRADLAHRWEELTPGEQALLESDTIRFWLPLVSRGTLRAILLLGDRQGEAVLSEEDLNILAPLAGQAGVAAENVSLLESLKARLVEVEQVRNALAEAHHRLVETQEAGQVRLARELHDSAVQQLLGISYQLVKQTWPGEGAAGAIVSPDTPYEVTQLDTSSVDTKDSSSPTITPELLRHEILGVVSQLRSMIGELRPAGLEHFGLTTALEGYISRLEREGLWAGDKDKMPTIEADFPANEPNLPESVALTLFRVAQEALRNALKHASAHEIRVVFTTDGDEAILTVSDDGEGFTVPVHLSELAKGNHFGLIGMAERVEWAGGKLDINSQAGRGTQVTARIPLKSD